MIQIIELDNEVGGPVDERRHYSRYHSELAAQEGCQGCNRPHTDPGALETRGGKLLCCQCMQELEEAQQARVVTVPKPLEGVLV